jgi:hypothetical protein
MKFIMKCMHRNGVTLSEEESEATPLYIGYLYIQEVRQFTPGKHPLLQARLLDCPDGEAGNDSVLPVFDPLVKISGGTMTIHGYQLCIGDDRSVRFYEQCWLLWPAVAKN